MALKETEESDARLWKLPEPWTHSTRPPLLGKSADADGFPTDKMNRLVSLVTW